MRGERLVSLALWFGVGLYIFMFCIFPIPCFDNAKAEACTCFGSFGGPWQPEPGWGKPYDGPELKPPPPSY